MATNSTKNNILRVLWEQELINRNNIVTEDEKREVIEDLKKKSEILLQIMPKIQDQSTDFENMDTLSTTTLLDTKIEIDEQPQFVFKQWNIEIPNPGELDIETLATIFMPYIKYTIIYDEPGQNDINFYADQEGLHEVSFWDMKEEALTLHVSVYMSTYFESDFLLIPQVKLLITYQNPFTVLT